jgi:ubiquinone/menaquinone biosynthesis C-methylase UbiE
MKSYYATRAQEYDKVYLKPERQADLRAIEQWLPPLFSGQSVVEIACGTGYWTQFIAPVANNILAIDAAAETLNIAKNRVPANKVEFLVGDAYALPRYPIKFDSAFSGFWFSHVPKNSQHEFLRGLHAMLKPGAKIVLLDNRFVDGSSTPITGQDEEGNTFQPRTLSEGTRHKVLKNFPSETELRKLVSDLGVTANYSTWQHYWAFEYITPEQ